MAEKKTKKTKKIDADTRVLVQPKTRVAVRKEDVLPLIEIAEINQISSYDLFMIKKYANIDEGALLTQSEFKELYEKAMKGV